MMLTTKLLNSDLNHGKSWEMKMNIEKYPSLLKI